MIERLKKEFFPEYTAVQVDNSRSKFSVNWLLHVLWLFLSVAVISFLRIEMNQRFPAVAVIISLGFVFYSFTPLKFKKVFLFLLAFLVEFALLLKPAIGVTAIIIVFVGLTYIRSKILRNALILLITALSILVLLHIIRMPVTRIIIMYAALFLMLRYIFLLYELNYVKTKPVFIDRLCYLFLLPNACFPLFAIVDPKLFMSRFYDVPGIESFKKGLTWITRGILHTVIYRLVYLYLTPSPYEIDGFWKLLLFIFSSYSLILRLSGLYYMSLGFLCLFGFNLPTIFDHYFFASGFPDLWRRINLYWRSFMQRVFYYPMLFRLKKVPIKLSILITTLFMFACTWFLHAWQWFWIKGKYIFTANDILFWSILGIVIAINSVLVLNAFENKKNNIAPSVSFLKKGAGVIFMLMNMSLLWSLWTASSLTEWWYIMSFLKMAVIKDVLIFAGIVLALMLIASGIRYLYETRNYFAIVFRDFKLLSGLSFTGLFLILFFVMKQSSYRSEVMSFASNTLNTKDKMAMERGYYETVLNNDEKSIELFNLANLNKKWNLDNQAYTPVNSILMKEFKPNFSTVFKGDSLSTNAFGLRDKDYDEIKKAGTVRIAAIGGSYEMGSGVSNEQNFLALVERQINKPKYTNKSVEILNYGEGGYHLLQNVYVTENKVKKLGPDYVFYFAHTSELSRCLENFINVIDKKMPLSYTFLDSVYKRSGITDNMCRLEKYNRIKPFINDIIHWGYFSISTYCKRNNIIPVLVYLPTNANLRVEADKEFCLMEAAKAGFDIVDLSGVYEGQNPNSIQLSQWDAHPNRKGHQLIADKLLTELLKKKGEFQFLK